MATRSRSCRPRPARLLPDALFRRHARGPRGRRHHPRDPAQRDLRPRRRVELRQDLIHQDDRRREPTAAQRGRRLGRVQLSRPRHPQARRGGARGRALEAHLLHHAGLDERAEPGPPGAPHLRRLRLPPHRPADARVHGDGRGASRPAAPASRACSTPIRTSCRAACGSAWRSRSPPSAGPSSSSPTSRPPRSTWWCRRTCWR